VIEPFEDPASKNTPPVIRFQSTGPSFTGPPTAIAATLTASPSKPLAIDAWVTDEPPKLNVATAQLTTAADAPLLAAAAAAAAARGGDRGAAPADAAPAQAAGRGRGRGAAAGQSGPPLPVIGWSLFRGPGAVTFDPARPMVNRADGKATTMATFAAPGEYVLRLQANDSSGDGGGGFQCCWTNAHVAVTVR